MGLNRGGALIFMNVFRGRTHTFLYFMEVFMNAVNILFNLQG